MRLFERSRDELRGVGPGESGGDDGREIRSQPIDGLPSRSSFQSHTSEGWSSVGVLRVGPGREAGEYVELSQQAADHFFSVLLAAELIELAHDARQRSLHIENRALRVVLALMLEALLMFEE